MNKLLIFLIITLVFVMGCNSFHFPCRGSEHPVIDMIKVEEYDKEEEERRSNQDLT